MTMTTDYGWTADDVTAMPPDHSSCDECGDVHADDTMTTTGDGDVICGTCRSESWRLCRYCADYFHTDDVATAWDGIRDLVACERCRDLRGWEQCESCDTWCIYGTHNDYCESCASDRCDCSECSPDDDDDYYGHGAIRGYSYKPEPIMHGDGRYHLGLELEIEAPYRSDVGRAAAIASEGFGDVAYLKDDCSINHGFEIVTHPMTHEYASQSFPWATLDKLREMGCDGDNTGIHVHVSRSAFDTAGHVYRWMKLIYRNRRDVQRIARRKSDEWAAFSPYTSENIKSYAKATALINKGQAPRYGDGMYGERYSAINVNNYHTFEVRVFRASVEVEEVRAALDLVAASVEYTRDLTVAEIVHGGWTWDNFMTWAAQRSEYSALVAQNATV